MFIILGAVLVLLLFAAVVIMIRSRFYAPNEVDNGQNDRQLYDRLKQPKFDDLERQFGSILPDELRWLYGQRDLILKRNVRIDSTLETGHEYEIDHFLPADVKSIRELWFEIGEKRFPFAIDGFGNYFFVELHEGKSKPATVFYIDHDGGAIWPIAHSLKTLLSSVHTT